MENFEYGGNFFEKIEESNLYLNNKENCLFFDSGRSAIKFLINSICNKHTKVLLPAYTCNTVIIPFLEINCNLFFYPVDKNFKIDAEKFQKLVELCNPNVILIHSYFGFDTIKNLYPVLNHIMSLGIYIIEDITHSLFSYNHTFQPDFRVGSLRKWCGVLDGGFLTLKSAKAKKMKLEKIPKKENEEFIQLRRKAQHIKWEYISGIRKEMSFISFFEESEEILNKQDKIYNMSDITRRSITGIDWSEIKKKRIENFFFLKKELQNTHGIIIPTLEFEKNTIPFFFPVFIDKNIRDSLRNNLRKKSILLPVIWPKPEFWKFEENVCEIYNEILAIPCDQRYSDFDIKAMTQELKYELKKYNK